MPRTVVRKHFRARKNKVSVIRKHSRKTVGSKIEVMRSRYGINTPIGVQDVNDGPSDSYAYTDTTMKDGVPMDHMINIAEDKIKMAGENPEKILQHELAHVLAKETKLLTTNEGKNIITAIKQTKAYKLLQAGGDPYELQTEELFARAYAQYKTNHTMPTDIKTGYAWAPNDFRRVSSLLKKLDAPQKS